MTPARPPEGQPGGESSGSGGGAVPARSGSEGRTDPAMPTPAPAHPTVRFLDDEGQTRTGELTLWRRLDDGAWWADVTVDNGGEGCDGRGAGGTAATAGRPG